MGDKQPEALRMANALDDAWAPSRYGMARNEQAAALLRTQHAAIERKDALLRQAVELIGSFSAIDICETQHHKKADQHSHIAQCPVAERYRAVWFSIKQELSQ